MELREGRPCGAGRPRSICCPPVTVYGMKPMKENVTGPFSREETPTHRAESDAELPLPEEVVVPVCQASGAPSHRIPEKSPSVL